MVIDLLLLRSKICILFLQLQRLDHILAAVEPQNQIVTGRQAFRNLICLLVQLCQLIGPFFIVLLRQIFLQDIDLLIEGRTSSSVDLVFQDIFIIIMRRRLNILRIVLNRLVKLFQVNGNLHQTVENGTAHR